MNRRGISPFVGTVIILLTTLAIAFAIGVFVFGWGSSPKPIANTSVQTFTQTTTTTDYFSWSCQQLKDQINKEMTTYYSGAAQDNRSNGGQLGAIANALLQIYHYKGCSP